MCVKVYWVVSFQLVFSSRIKIEPKNDHLSRLFPTNLNVSPTFVRQTPANSTILAF